MQKNKTNTDPDPTTNHNPNPTIDKGPKRNNTHTHQCCQQWSHTHYSTPHTLWALNAATIVADAAVTPRSQK